MAKLKTFFRKLKSLVVFQLSDKLDFSWLKSPKETIRKIVFSVLKFVLIAGVVAVVLQLFEFLTIINKAEMVDLYVLFFTLIMALLLIGDTHKLTMSLYYAEDNKLLVTFPVSSSTLFLSKIINFFVFDFIKNLNLFDFNNENEFVFTLKKEHLYPYDATQNPEGLNLLEWFENYSKEAKVSTATLEFLSCFKHSSNMLSDI